MEERIRISGFSDEIDMDLNVQLQTVKDLGMKYVCLRFANGRSIADFTEEEAKTLLLPKLESYGIGVSSLGSPIGKIPIGSEEDFEKQKVQLRRLCRVAHILDTRFIRVFSFFIPEGTDPDSCRDEVVRKMREFALIAEEEEIILIHENEKDIYGDIGRRCKELLTAVSSPVFRAAFDFANFVQCGEDPEKCWDLLWEDVAYIHIKDAVYTSNENVLCGTGDGKIEKILRRAICDLKYEGFLTLEPHLVLFDSLQNLETQDAKDVIKKNKYENGAQGFAAQLSALQDILKGICAGA